MTTSQIIGLVVSAVIIYLLYYYGYYDSKESRAANESPANKPSAPLPRYHFFDPRFWKNRNKN